jgi:hypothetical protein
VIEQVLIFAAAVSVFAIVGIGLGMLVAPRLGRVAERIDEPADEDPGDRPD